ncbi:MAG TPA: alpha/beta fold hydrolase [Chitinophagaceae bacterium]|nr:alpha/beta fold hydrolase [Chitinophagaceae bacterium]
MHPGLKTSDIKKSDIRHLLLILVILVSCSGCFRRFVQTDKQIREYYKDKPVKPTYFTIQNDSVKLFCAAAGADTLPPLLIIHGAPGAWYGSRNLLNDSSITNRFHVISVDRPGYNKSTFKGRRRAVTSIDIQAVAIYEAMRLNHSRKKGVIMGSSYGGPIAAKIAIDHPEAFYHVLLLAAAIDPDHEKFWWFNKYVHHGPLKWLLPRFFRTATNEKYTHEKELRKLLPGWSKLTVPVTAVQGDADRIVSPVNLDFARKVLAGKNASFILIPGADHLIRWQHADIVRKILLDQAAGDATSHLP